MLRARLAARSAASRLSSACLVEIAAICAAADFAPPRRRVLKNEGNFNNLIGLPLTLLQLRGDEAVAWCQYGTPEELPNIHHRKEYEAALDKPPDYRITCIFVDKKHRRKGVTAAALSGAVDLIAQAGGGVVEGYPHDTGGQKVSVLYNGTRSLYERAGFSYLRPKGQRNCVMRRVVP